jgi:hypothetical protein
MCLPCSFVRSVLSKGPIVLGLNKLDGALKLLSESNGILKDADAICISKISIIDTST